MYIFKLKISEYFVLSVSILLDLCMVRLSQATKRDGSGGCAGAPIVSPAVEYNAVC